MLTVDSFGRISNVANIALTSSNIQINSLGVGTAGSNTTGEIRATNNITAYYSDDRLKTRLGNINNAVDKVKKQWLYHYQHWIKDIPKIFQDPPGFLKPFTTKNFLVGRLTPTDNILNLDTYA